MFKKIVGPWTEIKLSLKIFIFFLIYMYSYRKYYKYKV